MSKQITFSTDLKSSVHLEGYSGFALLHLSASEFGYMLDLSEHSSDNYVFMRMMVSVGDFVKIIFEYSDTEVDNKLHYKIEYNSEENRSYIYSIWNETGRENFLASQDGLTIFDNILNRVSIKFSSDFKSFTINFLKA